MERNGLQLDLVTKFVDRVDEKVLDEIYMYFLDYLGKRQDEWFCIDCFEYLGRDMPDGVGCGQCCHFYCETCAEDRGFLCRECGKNFNTENDEQ